MPLNKRNQTKLNQNERVWAYIYIALDRMRHKVDFYVEYSWFRLKVFVYQEWLLNQG